MSRTLRRGITPKNETRKRIALQEGYHPKVYQLVTTLVARFIWLVVGPSRIMLI
jgi:hypothetical protein